MRRTIIARDWYPNGDTGERTISEVLFAQESLWLRDHWSPVHRRTDQAPDGTSVTVVWATRTADGDGPWTVAYEITEG